jgi:hypothetical protein
MFDQSVEQVDLQVSLALVQAGLPGQSSFAFWLARSKEGGQALDSRGLGF